MTQPQFVCFQSLHHPDSHDSTTVCAKFVPTAANQAEVRLSCDCIVYDIKYHVLFIVAGSVCNI